MLCTEGIILPSVSNLVLPKYLLILAMAQQIYSIEDYVDSNIDTVEDNEDSKMESTSGAKKTHHANEFPEYNIDQYTDTDSYEYKDEPDSFDVHLDPEKCFCGLQDLQSAEDGTRIVGGEEAAENEFPWMVRKDIFVSFFQI